MVKGTYPLLDASHMGKLILAGTVLFDLDGTLIRSEEISFQCMDEAFQVVMGRRMKEEERIALMGRAVSQVLHEMHGDRGMKISETGHLLYRNRISEIPLYEGINEMLDSLSERGIRMGIVTSSRGDLVNDILDSLSISRYFDTVVTQDSTSRHKPEPEPVLECLKRLSVEPGNAIYIGDQPWDMISASSAGVRPYGVSWGPGVPSVLRESGAMEIFSDPSEIVSRVHRDAL